MPTEEWLAAKGRGQYTGSSDDKRDGFIHFSAKHQLQATAEKYFSGQQDLLLIGFEEHDLSPELKWEPSRGGDLFPHLYGPLDPTLAKMTVSIALDGNDVPVIPEEIDQ